MKNINTLLNYAKEQNEKARKYKTVISFKEFAQKIIVNGAIEQQYKLMKFISQADHNLSLESVYTFVLNENQKAKKFITDFNPEKNRISEKLHAKGAEAQTRRFLTFIIKMHIQKMS